MTGLDTQMTLDSVKRELAERGARLSTMTVAAKGLRFDKNGHLIADGRTLSLAAQPLRKLARWAGVPADFFAKCPTDVRTYLFNRLFSTTAMERSKAQPGKTVSLVLTDDSRVVGIADAELALLSGAEVLDIALKSKPSGIDEAQLAIAEFRLNGDLRVSIVSPQINAEPRVDDVVTAGVDIHHSDVGQFGTQIESYLLRLRCTNGMLAKICQHTHSVPRRIRRAAAQNQELTRRRVGEMAEAAWTELSMKLEAVKILANEQVDNPAAFIRSMGEQLRFPEKLIGQVIEALSLDEVGPSGTVWDVVNAFSRVGTHSNRLSTLTRRYLQGVSGYLIEERVERCQTCGRVRRGGIAFLPRR